VFDRGVVGCREDVVVVVVVGPPSFFSVEGEASLVLFSLVTIILPSKVLFPNPP
jgi:hypothetical protein